MHPEPDSPEQAPKPSYMRYIFAAIILALVLWGAIRACSDVGVGLNRPYRIAQERLLNNINVTGKEKNLEAFANDIIKTIAKRKNISIQLLSVSPGLVFVGLEDGQYDAVITTLVPNAANEVYYEFSDPLYRVGSVLIVPMSSSIEDFAEVEGKVIGITREESTFFEVGIYPEVLFYSYDDEIDALEDLENGKLDGVVMNAWPAYSLISTFFRGKLKVATKPFTKQGLRVATLNVSPFAAQLSDFDEGLAELKRDGTYQALIKKWGLIDTELEGVEVIVPAPENGEIPKEPLPFKLQKMPSKPEKQRNS
jgi:polar amino acid transport system substrate-binding protein